MQRLLSPNGSSNLLSFATGRKSLILHAPEADLLDRVIVRSVPASRLISVKFSGSNPKDCQTIVTAIVDQRILEHKAEIDSDNQEKAHSACR